ncbi:hypothetical protein [Maribellus sp. YY47]|nr:hypothetical protein [Maribellus sp. YY47]MCK3686434.1 hypothetical protein [Maribellus sp. YY47]
MRQVAQIYNSVKQAAQMNIPGAKAIFEDLKKRFMKTRSANNAEQAE